MFAACSRSRCISAQPHERSAVTGLEKRKDLAGPLQTGGHWCRPIRWSSNGYSFEDLPDWLAAPFAEPVERDQTPPLDAIRA
jgi:hypothetical protein